VEDTVSVAYVTKWEGSETGKPRLKSGWGSWSL